MHQAKVYHDINTLSAEELTDLYGIEISNDETVWDPCEMKEFKTLEEWAAYMVEQEEEDNYSSFTKIGGRGRFDDEY